MRVVTKNDIKQMNKLYLELKTYAAVGRATGFSPSTVKKYIIPDYQPVEEKDIIRFDKPLPEFDSSIFAGDDWSELCLLTEDEVAAVRELWKELEC